MQSKLIALLLFCCSFVALSLAAEEDMERNFKDIVTSRGYSFEEHFVLTKDNYVLSLFRISGMLNRTS